MKVYKVLFKDNVAMCASFIGYSFKGDAAVELTATGKRMLKYICVLANNEEESIEEADSIASDYFKLLYPRLV